MRSYPSHTRTPLLSTMCTACDRERVLYWIATAFFWAILWTPFVVTGGALTPERPNVGIPLLIVGAVMAVLGALACIFLERRHGRKVPIVSAETNA